MKMAKEVIVTAEKVKKRKKWKRLIWLALLFFSLFLIITYVILSVIYDVGNFTVALDRSLIDGGMVLYESRSDRTPRRRLYAENLLTMDNISYRWLPNNIDREADGSHNGENHIAYSFYVENRGRNVIHYWYEVNVDSVFRNVDEAIRIRIYHNHVPTVYAKKSAVTGEPENIPHITEPFREDIGHTIILEQRRDFEPGDYDRFTIVIWIDGDDPECLNPLIGGAMKLHMRFVEQQIRR